MQHLSLYTWDSTRHRAALLLQHRALPKRLCGLLWGLHHEG